MSYYVKCSSCNGYGYISCNDCSCQTCEGQGKINCSNCTGGYKSCGYCNGSGQAQKKSLFFSHSKPCPACEGNKKFACYFCKGSGFVTCPKCNGKGILASCSKCGGARKIRCSNCKGTGKIESEWFKSLTSLPIDRLRFEYEKRQREVNKLQLNIAQLSRELDELYDWYDRERRDKPWIENHPGAHPSGLDSIPREISGIENRISELEDEMKAIDQVISAKWK